MDILEGFKAWSEKNEAILELESQITDDKLKQGINGIEYLVLNKDLTVAECDWLERFRRVSKYRSTEVNTDNIFIDALTMDSEDFYNKHNINWWIARDDAIVQLRLYYERDYDHYFKLLKNIENVLG